MNRILTLVFALKIYTSHVDWSYLAKERVHIQQMPRGRRRLDGRASRGRKSRTTSPGIHDECFVSTHEIDKTGLGAWRAHEGFAVSNVAPLSLRDEARNTENQQQESLPTSLRHSRVAFVSAGHSNAEDWTRTLPQGTKHDEETMKFLASPSSTTLANRSQGEGPEIRGNQAAAQDNGNDDTDVTSDRFSPHQQMACMTLTETSQASVTPFESDNPMASGGVKSSQPDKNLEEEVPASNSLCAEANGFREFMPTACPPPQLRMSPSLEDSDVGEEEIVFTGRNTCSRSSKSLLANSEPKANHDLAYGLVKATEVISSPRFPTVLDDLSTAYGLPYTAKGVGSKSFMQKEECTSSAKVIKRSSRKPTRSGQPQGTRRQPRRAVEDDEILEDYIANMQVGEGQADYDMRPTESNRDLCGFARLRSEGAISISDQISIASSVAWDSADIQDFDDFSTSSEDFGAVNEVLAKRERPSGTQYLVIGDGLVVDEARWLPLSSLVASEDTAILIRTFEEEKAAKDYMLQGDNSDESLTDEAQIVLDVQEALDEIEDDRDLEERLKARMTDEQIAKLLSKQEELGIDSGHLTLFNGDENDDFAEARFDRLKVRLPPRTRKCKGKKRASLQFPSATAFAQALEDDPCHGFDIMNQERPRLRKRQKGRRSHLDFGLSDSELEQGLRTAWENDRGKKKARKREREKLRSQGLLGVKNRSNKKPDLKAKYPDGLNMIQIKAEIEQFLSSSAEQLALPPMDANARRTVHEVCHRLALKTQSRGSGKSRYPVVYKTSRTRGFDDIAFTSVHRKFLPRPGRGKKTCAPVARVHRGALAGVSYRDGEVVGAAAPELGQDNRGRAMLEKMGWSTGTALGAANNKGIPVPVAQIVKTTRAGLG
ncbi:MAG: hypothetical protein Q9217_001890 [Psora testacea]